MATLKHYVANEQELDRQTSSSNIDGRTLREVYDAPFGSPSPRRTRAASCARTTRSTACTPARTRS